MSYATAGKQETKYPTINATSLMYNFSLDGNERHNCLNFSFFSNGEETVETEPKIKLRKVILIEGTKWDFPTFTQNPAFSNVSCVWAQLYLHSK